MLVPTPGSDANAASRTESVLGGRSSGIRVGAGEPGVPEGIVAKALEAVAHRDRTFRAALAGGVPMAMGTDAATPFNRHGENAQELVLMVACGMTAMQAIVASTARAARALGRDDLGALEPGKLADLAVFEGDPLADVRVLSRPPRAVFLEGRRVA